MITKHPFKKYLIDEFIKYAKTKFPEEACGFFVNDKFIPQDNIHPEPENNFEIDVKQYLYYLSGLQCIVHSHNNYAHLSKNDMIQQRATNVPWGMVNLINNSPNEIVFWGNGIDNYPLKGRPFVHGVWDCYGLVKSYYKNVVGIDIQDFVRENFWWNTDPSLLEDRVNDAHFYKIDPSEKKEGDVVFMKIISKVTNHCGIIKDRGLILHHMYNRLSNEEPIGRYNKYITGYYRYMGE